MSEEDLMRLFMQLEELRELDDKDFDLPSRDNDLLCALLQEVCFELRSLKETKTATSDRGRELHSLREAIKYQLNLREPVAEPGV